MRTKVKEPNVALFGEYRDLVRIKHSLKSDPANTGLLNAFYLKNKRIKLWQNIRSRSNGNG